MITMDGTEVRLSGVRHKFSTALAEYAWGTLTGTEHECGDSSAPMGWNVRIGRRIFTENEQGFVSETAFPSVDDAEAAMDALGDWHRVWSWDDEDATEEREAELDETSRYALYVLSCAREGLVPHGREAWVIHTRPRTMLG